MKSLKVSIQDEYTLVLQEDGKKGDTIDLKSLHETDIDKTTITSVVNSIKKDAFNDALRKERETLEREMALAAKLKEQELLGRVSELEKEKLMAVELAEAKTKGELAADVAQREAETAKLKAEKEAEIAALRAKIAATDTERKLALNEAVSKIEKERDQLANDLMGKQAEHQLLESSLKDKYESQIRDREDTIERLKDMKAKLSVKLVGETLEQHCQNEFNSVRAITFPFAYFEKDNEAIKEDDETKGTKGDYLYRDYESRGGAEIISIMFEMKDEQDVSANKKTVESHLDKLDKDRKKKSLEYAVLVTLLEADNELYNRGIVDLSYKYDKMYVIRPQFFLPLISLLKSANMKSADDKRQLVAARNSNVDIENFVDNMETWKSGWANNMKNAAKKHSEAIEQIDKAIKDLQKVRDALTTSDKHLLAAENKMDALTIKRLTKNAPSVATRFEEIERNS